VKQKQKKVSLVKQRREGRKEKTVMAIKTNTNAAAHRARVFIDSGFSYRIHKNKNFANFAS
jgi:hypothetical protein